VLDDGPGGFTGGQTLVDEVGDFLAFPSDDGLRERMQFIHNAGNLARNLTAVL
jgi:hypothetical protein